MPKTLNNPPAIRWQHLVQGFFLQIGFLPFFDQVEAIPSPFAVNAQTPLVLFRLMMHVDFRENATGDSPGQLKIAYTCTTAFFQVRSIVQELRYSDSVVDSGRK